MATLQVRDIDERLYSLLKTSARLQNRSISQEVVSIIKDYLTSNRHERGKAIQDFLSLSGAWIDERNAEEIIKDLKDSRKQSGRFGEVNGIFD